MFKLYTSEFNIKMKLVFDMYDFDKDGTISKEDVSLMLSHAPIEKPGSEATGSKEGKITQSGVGREDYLDRAESQKELQNLVDICFGDKARLTFEDFKSVSEKVTSEMFLCLFSLLKTHFPSLAQFKRYEQGVQKKKTDSLLRTPILVVDWLHLNSKQVLSSVCNCQILNSEVESRTLRVSKGDELGQSEKETKTSLTAQRPYLS
jgi:hypothetical protein